MPPVECRSCKGKTNTAVSEVDDLHNWGKYADRCFARLDEGGLWIEGCAKPEGYMKSVIAELLKNEKPPATPKT